MNAPPAPRRSRPLLRVGAGALLRLLWVTSTWCLLLRPSPSRAEPAAAASVLVLPVAARGDVNADLASLLGDALTSAIARETRGRVFSTADVERTLTQDQLRQLAGCSTDSCAAEIGGALDADEIIVGTLTRVDDSYVLALSRLRSRNAEALTRLVHRFPVRQREHVLDDVPALAARLMGRTPRTTSTSPWPRVLRASGAVMLCGAVVAALVAAAAGTTALAITAYDLSGRWDGRARTFRPEHAITVRAAIVSDFALGVTVLTAAIAVLVGAGTLVAWGASWVVP